MDKDGSGEVDISEFLNALKSQTTGVAVHEHASPRAKGEDGEEGAAGGPALSASHSRASARSSARGSANHGSGKFSAAATGIRAALAMAKAKVAAEERAAAAVALARSQPTTPKVTGDSHLTHW